MNSLNVMNLKNPDIRAPHTERCNSATKNRNEDKISEFFDRHETTRKIVTYLSPIVLVGGALIEATTSHKVLSEISITSFIAWMMIGFGGLAKRPERSLQNKKVERLN